MVPRQQGTRQRRVRRRVSQEVRRHARTRSTRQSAEAYATGQVIEDEAKQTGKVDNKTIIAALHKGSWPTLVGNLSWDANGSPTGSVALSEWVNGKLVPVFPPHQAKHAPVTPKPDWAG